MSADTGAAAEDEHLAGQVAASIARGGSLEHDVQQLADVLGVWRQAPQPEREFLRVDNLAAGQLVRVLRLVLEHERGTA